MNGSIHSVCPGSRIASTSRAPRLHLLAPIRPSLLGATQRRGPTRCQRLLLPSRPAAGAHEGPTGATGGGDQLARGENSHGNRRDGSGSSGAAAGDGPLAPGDAAPDLEEAARLAREAFERMLSAMGQPEARWQFRRQSGSKRLQARTQMAAGAASKLESRAVKLVTRTERLFRTALAAVSRHAPLRRAALAEASRLEALQQTATEAVQRAEAVLAAAQEAASLLGALKPQARGLRGEIERAVSRAEDTRQKALDAHADLERARQAFLAAAALGVPGVRQRALELVAAVYDKSPEAMEEFLAANASRPQSESQLDRAALEAAARLEATGGDPSEYLGGRRRREGEGEEKMQGPQAGAATGATAAPAQGGGASRAATAIKPFASLNDGQAGGNPSSTSSATAALAKTDSHEAQRRAKEAEDRVAALLKLLPSRPDIQRLCSNARKAAVCAQRAGSKAAKAAEKAESALDAAQDAVLPNDAMRKRLLAEVNRMEQQRQEALEFVTWAEAVMVAAHEAAPFTDAFVMLAGLPAEEAKDAGDEEEEEAKDAGDEEEEAEDAGDEEEEEDYYDWMVDMDEDDDGYDLCAEFRITLPRSAAEHVEWSVGHAVVRARRICELARNLQQELDKTRQRALGMMANGETTVAHQSVLDARLVAAHEALEETLAPLGAALTAVKEVAPVARVLGKARRLQRRVQETSSNAAQLRTTALEAHAQLESVAQSLQGVLARVEGVRERALEAMAVAQGVEREEVPGFLDANAYRPTGAQLDREALEAVAYAEGASGSGVEEYLAHHMFRCRNGHSYMVAGCGNPEETATCPICNAPVGKDSGDDRIGADL